MKKTFTFFCFSFLLLIFNNLGSYSQVNESLLIKGKVISQYDSLAIPFAHVIQLKSNIGNICDENGSFCISTSLDDTLLITAIGFGSKKVPVNIFKKQSVVLIFIEQEVYTIDEVVIVPYKNYKELKEAVLALELPAEPEIELNIPKPLPKIPDNENGEITIISCSPISALYNAFSREAKELKEYNRIIERKYIESKISKKYNKDIITHITGITGERNILDFIEFCRFSDEFILNSNDYEIYLAINNCFEEFKKVINTN